MYFCQHFVKCLLVVIPLLTFINVTESANDRDIIRIPLVREQSGLEMLMEKGADYKLIEGLLKMGSHPIKNPATNDTLPLFKYFDSQYFGLVNIGKPGKTFKMVFDTAWSHSWVVSVDCPLLSLQCAIHKRYDHSVSSTYKPNGTTFNISGEMIGYFSKDVFLVGQMNATDQAFVEMSKLPWLYSLQKGDGVVGLGLPANSRDFLPFFYNFYQQNHLKEAIFSFYMNRDPTTEHGGSILFGGIDKKHQKGNFTTVEIVSDSFWTFKMNRVKLITSKKKFIEFCTNGCTATADMSTNIIVGPPDDIKKINTEIGTEGSLFDRALIPCVMEFKGPKVNFTIANKDFQILARDYVQKMSYSGFTVCLSAFQEADEVHKGISDWMLGGAFFYQFYSAFDVRNKKLMIAEAA